MSAKRNRGFTLIEMMIVVVIVTILLSVALPAYQHQIRKTKRAIGKGHLLEVASRQEQFFANNKTYAQKMTDLGYTFDTDDDNDFMIDTDGEMVTDTSTNRIYIIRMQSVSATEFLLHAEPELNQEKDTQCMTFTLDHMGSKGIIDGALSVEECW